MASIPTLPRLPVLPDLLRRVRVAHDLDAVTSFGERERPEAAGISAETAERIWSAAVDLYRSGVHPAVQVCVRREGTVVLDRAIGHARGNGPHDGAEVEKELATPRTPFVIYSGSKAFTAFLVHMLHERGELNISHHVCHYIPEYACNGKRDITVGHLLAHRAGVPGVPREALDLERAGDREFRMRVLCDAKPFARAGRFLAYHAVSSGYILGEIVQRVTGRELRELLASEILEPLGFRWSNYGVAARDVRKVALNYATGLPVAPPISLVLARALGVPFDEVTRASNDPRFLTSVVPSANVVSTANELSRFYEIFRRGGELDGVRVMSAEAVRDAIAEQSHLEVDLSLGFPTRFSYGLMLGARLLSLYGPDTQHAFGHLGFTNILAWADPQRAISCAIVTNGKPLLYPELPLFYRLMQRITSSAPKVRAREMVVWDPLAGPPQG